MVRYLNYNVIVAYTLSMYKVPANAGTLAKFLFYSWRIIGNLGLGSGMILSICDIIHKGITEINLMAVNIMNIVIFFSSLTRINYFYFREDKLESIVNTINTVYKHKTNVGLEEKTIDWYDKFTKIFVIMWGFSVFFTGEFMALLPLGFIHKTGRVLPLSLWYPYDWKKSPYYEFTYFTQALTQFFMGFSYGNSDMFFVCITVMTTAQFEFLGWELKNLVYTALLKQGIPKEKVIEFKDHLDIANLDMTDTAENTHLQINPDILKVMSTEKFRYDLKQALNSCVEFHQTLLITCVELEDFFSPVLLPAMLFGIFYAIFIMYALMNSTNASMTMSLLEYICMAYSQIFCVTYIGQLLTNSTDVLQKYLYEMPWYLCDNTFKKSLSLVQMKLTKPIIITAWKFFDINLTTFVFAIKTSFSYLAFLQQVGDNQIQK